MRKRLVLLQSLAILFAVFQYGMRAAGQEEGGNSDRILSSIFHPYLTARIPRAGSVVGEWLATKNRIRICVHIHRRYHGMPLWRVLPRILIGMVYTYANRTARAVWCYCSDKVYLHQLIMKSVIFHTLREWTALVNEMLLMMAGDIESNPGPSTALTLKDAVNALHSVSHKWFDIGLQLDVPLYRLSIIETDRLGAGERMLFMLDYWMKSATDPLPSWKVLVNALKTPIVGESRLARELEEKYCSPEDHSSLGDKLTTDDLGLVMGEVIQMYSNWYPLGLQLSVRIGDLDRIRTQFHDPIDQFQEMLKTWLKSGINPSWKTLTDALRSIGESQLAEVLEARYCLVEKTEVDGSTSASDSQPEAPDPVIPTVVVDMLDTSLDQILATIPLQYQPLLEQTVSDIHFTVIVRTLTNWNLACADLGITEVEEEMITQEYRTTIEQRLAVLRSWKQKFGATATYRNLAKCSYNAGKPDLVEVVCKLLGAPTGLVVRQSASLQAFNREGHNTSDIDTARDIETGDTSHSSHSMPVKDTLEHLLAASSNCNVQGLAGDLPQKILDAKADSDSQGHVHQLADWKQWADTNPGVDVFPVEPSHLCQYLTHLVDTDGHEAAIAEVSKAMNWVHSLAGYISPVADPLVDTCLARLQEIQHQLEICDQLIRDKETLEFTLMQCMFIGLPRAGKSSLMRQLMGEQPLTHSSSTGIVDEAKKVILRPVIESDVESAEYATVQVLGMVWEKLMFDDEAVKFLQDMVRSFHSPSSTSESSSSVLNVQEAESRNDSGTVKEQLESSGSTVAQSQHVTDQDYAPVDPFKEALKNKKWDIAKQKLEGAWTLYLTDTGGQPEFQEVLPALISGPTVFIIVFNLLTGLDEKFEVKYVRQSGCGGNAKSKVLLVGTHKDQVTEEKIKEVDEQLQSMLKGTAFYEEGLIEYANHDERRMLFTVNNLSQDSEETVEIRAAIQKIGGKQKGKQYSFTVKIPATWLAFYLTLRKLQHRVLSYEECFRIARRCGIEARDELENALFFLHTRLGVVRHFHVDGLRDIVIKDPQLIFDKITELILETFTFADLPGRDRFEREGFFQASFIEVITKDERSELFTSSKLVQLLEHLNIIAPLENHKGELEYFMPCALRQVDPQQASVHSSSSLASLVFKFNCGYCPLGLFSALAVYLTQNKMNSLYDWELKQNFVFKNHCEFKVGPYKDVVALTAKDTHFLVSVTQVYTGQRDRSCKLDILCCEVRACIEKGISEASATMHYKCNATYRLGFYCNCAPSYPEDHITIIRDEKLGVLECLASDVPCEVLCEHRVWLSQLVQGDTAVVCDQQVSLPQATATLLTVDDLGVLKRLIQPVAAHWVALADQLGMTSLVSTIRSTPDNTGPPAFLRDLLYRWLTKGRPTLEELCQALREDDEIVGGAGVANNLEEWFRGQRGTDMMKQ